VSQAVSSVTSRMSVDIVPVAGKNGGVLGKVSGNVMPAEHPTGHPGVTM